MVSFQYFLAEPPALEFMLQLIFLSNNLFHSITHENDCLVFRLQPQVTSLTDKEQKLLLSHFLSLIQSLTLNQYYLLQDQRSPLTFRLYYQSLPSTIDHFYRLIGFTEHEVST